MFKKDSNTATELGKTNRIVEGTKINGDIVSQADFRLDGELVGNFQSNGKLVIGPAGSIIGEINCKNLDVEGKFEGKIHVTEVLSVKSKATIEGTVVCGKLAVEPGALFTASCSMKPNIKNLSTNHEERPQEKTA